MQMDIMKREQQEGIRINKYLSEAGYVPGARQIVRLRTEMCGLMAVRP